MDGFHDDVSLVSATDAVRPVLSLREATLLAGVPEASVRKDIEAGIVRPLKVRNVERLCFRWADVFLFAAVYRDGSLSSKLRRKAFEKLERLVAPPSRRDRIRSVDRLSAPECAWRPPAKFLDHCDRLSLGGYLYVDVEKVIEDVTPRVELYAEGLTRIEEREGVLGGEVVFRNTRLSVRHIGRMHDGGETVEQIRQDYPYLRESDVEFAHLYYMAHPIVGRPPTGREPPDAGDPATAR